MAPRFTLPADDGGKIGIFNITKQFAELGCEVTFFTFDDGTISDDHAREFEKYARLVTIEHKPENSIANAVNAFVRNDSVYLFKHFNTKIASFLDKFLKDNKFDVVHADHTAMARAALNARKKLGCAAGLRLHNVEWVIWKRYADSLSSLSPLKYYSLYQALLLRRYEGELIEKFDVAFPITDKDLEKAREIAPKARLATVPAGVDLNKFKSASACGRNPLEMIIATSFFWRHNTDGLKWFIAKVMPEIKRCFPNSRLTIIGKGSDIHFKSDPRLGIKALGYVPSVAEYLARAGICIAPLFVGGGIRIKILEALASGLPTVATGIAAEGIVANESNGLFLADSEQEFIARISFLMANPDSLSELGAEASEFVSENYSWRSSAEIMMREYLKAMKTR